MHVMYFQVEAITTFISEDVLPAAVALFSMISIFKRDQLKYQILQFFQEFIQLISQCINLLKDYAN